MGRAGSGIVLGLVALLVSILLLIGISQAFFSETVLDDAGAEQLGATALTIAESALEELQMAVRSGVNDPASPLHAAFRSRLLKNPDTGFEVPGLEARGAAKLAAKAGLALEVEVPRVTQRTLFHIQKATYNEHHGVIRYRVHAWSARTRPRVDRWLTATQEYKVIAASIPPPFDQVCFFAVDAQPVAGGGEANRAMEVFAGVRRKWTGYLGNLIQSSPGAAREIGMLRREFEKIAPLEEAGARDASGRGTVHRFPPDLTAFITPAFAAANPEIPGDTVELAKHLTRWRQEIETLESTATEKVNAIVRAGEEYKKTRKAPDKKVLEEGVTSMQALATRTAQYQDAIRQWQEMMAEHTGQSRKDLLTDVANLDSDLMRRKSFFTVRQSEANGDAGAALAKLRERLTANTGSDVLNGIVWIENPSSPLDLTNLPPVKGRVIYSVTGDVKVGNLGPAGATDLVAVVCHGTLSIAGDVTGGLAAMGTLKVERPAKIKGVLVTTTPPPGAIAQLTLSDDPSLRTGSSKGGVFSYQDKFFYVGVAPVLATRTIDRSKPRD